MRSRSCDGKRRSTRCAPRWPGGPGGEERRNHSEGFYIVSCCANIWVGSLISHVANFSVSSELVSIKPARFDDIEAHFGMWRSKFQAFLSLVGCLYVFKATDIPVMVGDINVSQEELERDTHRRRSLMRAWCMDC